LVILSGTALRHYVPEICRYSLTGGHGNVADSWVGTGQNQPINPNQLGNAIGRR